MLHAHTSFFKKLFSRLAISLLLLQTHQQKAVDKDFYWGIGGLTVISVLGYYGYNKYYGSSNTSTAAPKSLIISETQYHAAKEKVPALVNQIEAYDKLAAEIQVARQQWSAIAEDINQLDKQIQSIISKEAALLHPCRPCKVRIEEYRDPANTKSALTYVSEYLQEKPLCAQLHAEKFDAESKKQQSYNALLIAIHHQDLFPKKYRSLQQECINEYNQLERTPQNLRAWEEKYKKEREIAFIKDTTGSTDKIISDMRKELQHNLEILEAYQTQQAKNINN